MGWRLPTLQELNSLIDPLNSDGFSRPLPPGHPFSRIENGFYHSASSPEDFSSSVWGVSFVINPVNPTSFLGIGSKDLPAFVWCVRGGQGVNPQ